MIELFYVDTIRYEVGRPKALFLLADEELMKVSRIAVFGTGIEAYLIMGYLKEIGIKVDCFVNNDADMRGKKLCGIDIVLPSEVMNKAYYFISAMPKVNYNNEVLWQLKMHNQDKWGLAFIHTFHSYRDYDAKLQAIVMEGINEILCGGERKNKSIRDIIKLVANCGPSGNFMGQIPELCWTTSWSHCLIEWFYEKYALSHMTERGTSNLSMLEIGAGRGLFSLTAQKINPMIDIKWLCYNMEESSEKPVSGKYLDYPERLFETYFGVIEQPSYEIREQFDIIVMTEVLEHFVVNPVKTMKKIRDMLKEDGCLFLSTPNWGHLPLLDSYKELPEWISIEDYADRQVGHAYQYSKSELEELMGESGLIIEKYARSDSNSHNLIIRHKK